MAATMAEELEIERPRPSWDERRRLARDIAGLAAPDLPGVVLLVRNYRRAQLAVRELLGKNDGAGDQLECGVDLDAADAALLAQLRAYVDECYVPHFVPKENCGVCEGLWSCGRVVACGNDACNTRVHEECFGVVLRESVDGPWLCPSCLLGRELLCAVCMQSGGALKPLAPPPADTGEPPKWVHALCALAIPELVMRDVPTFEPVDGFEDIENGRFRYLCGVCRKRGGASVICEQEGCNVGLHPQCAADAGLMIGSEANPLGVFCEKHLPVSRIPGAKRWISDEDLVEEILSEYSIDEEFLEPLTISSPDADRCAFILDSTPFIYRKNKLLGAAATLAAAKTTPFPPVQAKDLDKSDLGGDSLIVNPSALAVPSAVKQGVQMRNTPVFPPPPTDRLGLPSFPQQQAAVGAIVDYLGKEQDVWQRARVLQWDAARGMHLVQVVATAHKVWTTLSSANTLVLYLPDEENPVDGVRVRLYRPWLAATSGTSSSGSGGPSGSTSTSASSREWRPKPRDFAPSV